MAEVTDSQILEARFPGYAWMPRWTRRYWTPSTAVALALSFFSAGAWFDNWRHRDALREATAEIKAQSDLAIKAIHDETDQLVKKNDLVLLESHVNDLWTMRIDIDSELARQEALKKSSAPKRRR